MDLKVDDRAYFVTGISRGVGLCLAEALLDESACVAGCARDAKALEELRDRLPETCRSRLATYAVDVTDRDGLAGAVNDARARFGRLDGVVANAGAGVSGGVLDTPAADWDAQMRLKVQSVLNLVIPSLPGLRESDAGRVVVVNGVTARVPEPGMAAVSSARAAVANLAQSLAVELAGDRIMVNTVNLGVIATDRQRDRHRRSGTSMSFDQWAEAEAIRRGVLLGRLGTPAEVVPAVMLLLSPLSSYVTGASIDVAGGIGVG